MAGNTDSTISGNGNERARGAIEADLKTILGNFDKTDAHFTRLYRAEKAMAERMAVVETKVAGISNGDRKGSILAGGGGGVVAGGSTFGVLKLIEWLASLPIFN